MFIDYICYIKYNNNNLKENKLSTEEEVGRCLKEMTCWREKITGSDENKL